MESKIQGVEDKELGIRRIKQVKNKTLVSKRRSQIMAAALDLFLEKGYHATTIRDIARRSGVNQGSLYDYVKNKEDILRILLEKTHQARDEFPEDEVEFKKRFNSLKEYLTHQFRYSWTQNRRSILLSYRITKSLKKEELKKLLSANSALADRIVSRISLYMEINGDEKRVEIIANIIVFLNAFMPMRDWNLKEHEFESILNLVVEMVLKILDTTQ